jgi:hypothetical protein
MRPTDEPARRDRLAEVASILAAGILRLHARTALPTEASSDSTANLLAKTSATCLEVPRKPC